MKGEAVSLTFDPEKEYRSLDPLIRIKKVENVDFGVIICENYLNTRPEEPHTYKYGSGNPFPYIEDPNKPGEWKGEQIQNIDSFNYDLVLVNDDGYEIVNPFLMGLKFKKNIYSIEIEITSSFTDPFDTGAVERKPYVSIQAWSIKGKLDIDSKGNTEYRTFLTSQFDFDFNEYVEKVLKINGFYNIEYKIEFPNSNGKTATKVDSEDIIIYTEDVEQDEIILGNDKTIYYAKTAATQGSQFKIYKDNSTKLALTGDELTKAISNINLQKVSYRRIFEVIDSYPPQIPKLEDMKYSNGLGADIEHVEQGATGVDLVHGIGKSFFKSIKIGIMDNQNFIALYDCNDFGTGEYIIKLNKLADELSTSNSYSKDNLEKYWKERKLFISRQLPNLDTSSVQFIVKNKEAIDKLLDNKYIFTDSSEYTEAENGKPSKFVVGEFNGTSEIGITFRGISVSLEKKREFLIKYTSQDVSGNSVVRSRKVTIENNKPPLINLMQFEPIKYLNEKKSAKKPWIWEANPDVFQKDEFEILPSNEDYAYRSAINLDYTDIRFFYFEEFVDENGNKIVEKFFEGSDQTVFDLYSLHRNKETEEQIIKLTNTKKLFLNYLLNIIVKTSTNSVKGSEQDTDAERLLQRLLVIENEQKTLFHWFDKSSKKKKILFLPLKQKYHSTLPLI